MCRSSRGLTMQLLMIMSAATLTLARSDWIIDKCLSEEKYKDISNNNYEILKIELDKIKDNQANLENLIVSMSDSLSSLRTSIASLTTDNDAAGEVFYSAAVDGNIGYIRAQLGQLIGNSSSNSSSISDSDSSRSRPLSLITWRNKAEKGCTALHAAAEHGHHSLVVALLEAGASPNVKDSDGKTPFYVAAEGGFEQMIHAMIEAGAILDLKGKYGRTALHKASMQGHNPIVLALLEAGANVNVLDEGRNTALHEAARENHLDTVRILLQHGINKLQEDIMGNTAADNTRHWGIKYREVTELIDNWP